MDYMLEKMIYLMKNLNVYEKNMLKNINLTQGLVFSQEVLLALIKKGITREESYKIVQESAMEVWKRKINFKKLLLEDERVTKYLSKNDLDNLFNLDKVLININKIYKRLEIKWNI